MAEGDPAESPKWRCKDINPFFSVHAQDFNEIEDNEGLVGAQTMLAGSVSLGKMSNPAAEFCPFTFLITSIFLR